MSGTNQYLAFGTGVGSNTLNYASYSATLVSLINPGYVAGTADAQHVNTVLRQATVGVAGVAKFSTDWGALNCMDDGSPTNYAAAVKSAVDAIIATAIAAIPSAPSLITNITTGDPGTITIAGVIVKWGTIAFGDIDPGVPHVDATGTFATAFPAACDNIQITILEPTGYEVAVVVMSKSASGFVAHLAGGSNVENLIVHWLAVGH